MHLMLLRFKPYYKWITFNTEYELGYGFDTMHVLNLIINGLPSIHKKNDNGYTVIRVEF